MVSQQYMKLDYWKSLLAFREGFPVDARENRSRGKNLEQGLDLVAKAGQAYPYTPALIFNSPPPLLDQHFLLAKEGNGGGRKGGRGEMPWRNALGGGRGGGVESGVHFPNPESRNSIWKFNPLPNDTRARVARFITSAELYFSQEKASCQFCVE